MSSRKASPGRRVARDLACWTAIAFLTVYLVRAFDARRMAPLEVWHTARLMSEFSERDESPYYDFEDYLAQEARLFEELEREVYDRVDGAAELELNRFWSQGSNDPRGREPNWNRSYELAPDPDAGPPRGAALLVHGLSDGPYSLHGPAEMLRGLGLHVVGLRLPGHGAAPAGLARVHWRDWVAAVRVGARHAHQRAGDGPLWLIGYSAGGALACHYAAEAALDDVLPQADQLVLFSPAIGIAPIALAGDWHRFLSWVPFFERFAWQEVEPEYDPYKFNSFPKRAGKQMHALAVDTCARLAAVERAGRAEALPPVLAFQSLVDDTVGTDAVLEELFARLVAPGSELVVFDVNDLAALRPFLTEPDRAVLRRVVADPERRFRLTHVVNRDARSSEVQALSYAPGTAEPEARPLGLTWPDGVYSLSHVAMPFAPDDPNYGTVGWTLGSIEPRGERGVLQVSVNNLMRLRYNPFFSFVEERIALGLE